MSTAVADYERWLHKAANDCLGVGHTAHDDLVQEGRLAMWRAEHTFDPDKGTRPDWLTGAARLRMRDVAWGTGQWTGHGHMRGRKPVRLLLTDEFTGFEPQATSHSEQADWAYHRPEIDAALGRLTAIEERAARRVMHGEPRSAVERAAWTRARPKLAADLEHLREAV